MDMPQVLSVQRQADPGRIRFTLGIPASLNVFAGHFDGAPIVPGVVQIHWALKLASQYLREISPQDIAHMEAVKFQHVMVPGNELALELELSTSKLLFVFQAPQGTDVRYSSGKVVLKS